jgi:hypothetical protein
MNEAGLDQCVFEACFSRTRGVLISLSAQSQVYSLIIKNNSTNIH